MGKFSVYILTSCSIQLVFEYVYCKFLKLDTYKNPLRHKKGTNRMYYSVLPQISQINGRCTDKYCEIIFYSKTKGEAKIMFGAAYIRGMAYLRLQLQAT